MPTFREWIVANIPNFNVLVASEEDLKIHALLPYLEYLGYRKEELRFNNAIDVQLGTRKATVFSDVEVVLNGVPQLVIDTKSPKMSLSDKNILQSLSYAKLVHTPPALLGTTTNGVDVVTTNVSTGRTTNLIPTRAELMRLIDKTNRQPLTEVELREVKSALITLMSADDLAKVIRRSKEVIEKKGLIRSDWSFREMTKILLVKMSEERRAQQKLQNRFSQEYIQSRARANETTDVDVFRALFEDAKGTYPGIYTDEEDRFRINDNECLIEVVRNIEDFSFLGTGDDIKREQCTRCSLRTRYAAVNWTSTLRHVRS